MSEEDKGVHPGTTHIQPEGQGAKPVRVQLKRTKGWKLPPNTVKVDRSTPWGNPFVIGKSGGAYTGGRLVQDRRHAWRLYQAVAPDQPELVARAQAELRGKNLACWCPHDDPYQDVCHAAVLLEIANGPLNASENSREDPSNV